MSFERKMRRAEAQHPYRMLDHLIRRQLPDVMASYEMHSTAIPFRELGKIETESHAYLAAQSLAATAIAHVGLAFKALELMSEEQRTELLAQAPDLNEIMERLAEA